MLNAPGVRVVDQPACLVALDLVAVDYPLQRTVPVDNVIETARRDVAYRDSVVVVQSRLVLRQAQFRHAIIPVADNFDAPTTTPPTSDDGEDSDSEGLPKEEIPATDTPKTETFKEIKNPAGTLTAEVMTLTGDPCTVTVTYGEETGNRVMVYRFPNLVGKWVRPNYNSAVGTFCNNIANDLPITVNDPSVELEMLFIDDLVEEMFDAIEGKEHHCEFDGVNAIMQENGRYCYAPVTHKATLGRIVELLHTFHDQPRTLVMPEIPNGSFEKKLYSMYLSYLPKEKTIFDLKMNCDDRGSFTELLKTANCGQFSVNISKPGITKGQHWHNSKWEFFIVVSGHGLIQERKIGTDEVIEFEVSGEKIQAVHMLPGYTHNIINLSETENLVTVMWANEQFDPNHPDTFFEKV